MDTDQYSSFIYKKKTVQVALANKFFSVSDLAIWLQRFFLENKSRVCFACFAPWIIFQSEKTTPGDYHGKICQIAKLYFS